MDDPDNTFSPAPLDTPQEDDRTTLSIMHFVRTFKRWWALVLLLAVIGTVGTCGVGFVRSRNQYQSSVQMLLGFAKADSYSASDIQNNVQLLGTFSHLVTSDAILAPVAKKANTSIADVRNSISTTTDSDSLIVTIQLTRDSASQTSSMIQEISSRSQRYINKHFPQTRAIILTPQITVSQPHIHYKRDAVFGFVGGFTLGCLLCLVLPEQRRNSSHSLHAAPSRHFNR